MKPSHISFLLAGLIAWGAHASAQAAPERFRLDRIGVSRFTVTYGDKLLRNDGVLHLDGRISWNTGFEIDRPANVQTWALNRTLVLREAWLAYRGLGFGATANFQLGEGAVAVPFGDSIYWVIEPNPEARFSDGRVINISTRARLAASGDAVIAGFVIDERHRWVLIRGVGPGLAAFGVNGALADPIITVRRGTTPFYFNDDWSSRPDAADIRAAAARVGAFALGEGSKDSALLVELPPGAYTVSVESAGPATTGGDVLVEVYSVPELD